MKILFLSGAFHPAKTGGGGLFVYWLCRALAKRNFKPFIITSNTNLPLHIPLDEWLDTDFGKVIYKKTWFHYLPLGILHQALKKIRKVDLVHVNSLFYPASFPVVLLAWWSGKKVIWSVHGELAPDALKFNPFVKRIYLWLVKRLIPKRIVTFHATSQVEASQIIRHFGRQTDILQLPVYMDLPEKMEVEKKKFFLFLGRVHPIKGLDNLIEALYRSAGFLASDFQLLIAGEGPVVYKNHLINRIKQLELTDKIQIAGHVSGKKKQQLLAGAHFLILPSHSENFGIVVIEALAQATPVIASTGTPWKVLSDLQAGFWIDNHPDSIAKCLNRTIHLSSEAYLQYSCQAQNVARNLFDIGKNIDRWLQEYAKKRNFSEKNSLN